MLEEDQNDTLIPIEDQPPVEDQESPYWNSEVPSKEVLTNLDTDSTPIDCFALNGTFLFQFSSVNDISICLNVDIAKVRTAVLNSKPLRGVRFAVSLTPYKEVDWQTKARTVAEIKMPCAERRCSDDRLLNVDSDPIECYHTTGIFLFRFRNVSDVSKSLNIDSERVRKVCLFFRRHAYQLSFNVSVLPYEEMDEEERARLVQKVVAIRARHIGLPVASKVTTAKAQESPLVPEVDPTLPIDCFSLAWEFLFRFRNLEDVGTTLSLDPILVCKVCQKLKKNLCGLRFAVATEPYVEVDEETLILSINRIKSMMTKGRLASISHKGKKKGSTADEESEQEDQDDDDSEHSSGSGYCIADPHDAGARYESSLQRRIKKSADDVIDSQKPRCGTRFQADVPDIQIKESREIKYSLQYRLAEQQDDDRMLPSVAEVNQQPKGDAVDRYTCEENELYWNEEALLEKDNKRVNKYREYEEHLRAKAVEEEQQRELQYPNTLCQLMPDLIDGDFILRRKNNPTRYEAVYAEYLKNARLRHLRKGAIIAIKSRSKHIPTVQYVCILRDYGAGSTDKSLQLSAVTLPTVESLIQEMGITIAPKKKRRPAEPNPGPIKSGSVSDMYWSVDSKVDADGGEGDAEGRFSTHFAEAPPAAISTTAQAAAVAAPLEEVGEKSEPVDVVPSASLEALSEAPSVTAEPSKADGGVLVNSSFDVAPSEQPSMAEVVVDFSSSEIVTHPPTAEATATQEAAVFETPAVVPENPVVEALPVVTELGAGNVSCNSLVERTSTSGVSESTDVVVHGATRIAVSIPECDSTNEMDVAAIAPADGQSGSGDLALVGSNAERAASADVAPENAPVKNSAESEAMELESILAPSTVYEPQSMEMEVPDPNPVDEPSNFPHRVMVYNGREILYVRVEDFIINNDDELIQLLVDAHGDREAALSLLDGVVAKQILEQFTLPEVHAYLKGVAEFKKDMQLFRRTPLLKKKSYKALVNFHYKFYWFSVPNLSEVVTKSMLLNVFRCADRTNHRSSSSRQSSSQSPIKIRKTTSEASVSIADTVASEGSSVYSVFNEDIKATSAVVDESDKSLTFSSGTTVPIESAMMTTEAEASVETGVSCPVATGAELLPCGDVSASVVEPSAAADAPVVAAAAADSEWDALVKELTSSEYDLVSIMKFFISSFNSNQRSISPATMDSVMGGEDGKLTGTSSGGNKPRGRPRSSSSTIDKSINTFGSTSISGIGGAGGNAPAFKRLRKNSDGIAAVGVGVGSKRNAAEKVNFTRAIVAKDAETNETILVYKNALNCGLDLNITAAQVWAYCQAPEGQNIYGNVKLEFYEGPRLHFEQSKVAPDQLTTMDTISTAVFPSSSSPASASATKPPLPASRKRKESTDSLVPRPSVASIVSKSTPVRPSSSSASAAASAAPGGVTVLPPIIKTYGVSPYGFERPNENQQSTHHILFEVFLQPGNNIPEGISYQQVIMQIVTLRPYYTIIPDRIRQALENMMKLNLIERTRTGNYRVLMESSEKITEWVRQQGASVLSLEELERIVDENNVVGWLVQLMKQCASHTKFRLAHFKSLFNQVANLPAGLQLPNVNLMGVVMVALNKGINLRVFKRDPADNSYSIAPNIIKNLVYPVPAVLPANVSARVVSASIEASSPRTTSAAASVAQPDAAVFKKYMQQLQHRGGQQQQQPYQFKQQQQSLAGVSSSSASGGGRNTLTGRVGAAGTTTLASSSSSSSSSSFAAANVKQTPATTVEVGQITKTPSLTSLAKSFFQEKKQLEESLKESLNESLKDDFYREKEELMKLTRNYAEEQQPAAATHDEGDDGYYNDTSEHAHVVMDLVESDTELAGDDEHGAEETGDTLVTQVAMSEVDSLFADALFNDADLANDVEVTEAQPKSRIV